MSPEVDVLLACARASLTAEGRARLRGLITPEIDWARIVALAAHHGVLPLVSHHLAGDPGAAVPASVRDELEAGARAVAGRNLMMSAELIRVVRRLEANGISALPYKGPLLAVLAYGKLGLRAFDDLDLLVPRRHVRAAARLLTADGYRPVYRLTPAQEDVYFRTQCEYIVEREDVRVELHWEIVPRYFAWPADLEGLWARSVPAALGEASLRTLAAEDLALVLCVHGAKHGWQRLEWIASFAELARRSQPLDWAGVGRAARGSGAGRMLAVGLWLARDLLDVDLPARARAHAEGDGPARALAAEVAVRLRSGETSALERSREVRFHLRARERMRDRLRYAARLATTQTLGDWDLVGLPRGGAALYRVIRPVRLLAKFGPRALTRSLAALTSSRR